MTEVVYLPSPLTTEGAQVFRARAGESFEDFLVREELHHLFRRTTVTVKNGDPFLEADWRAPLGSGDLVCMQRSPEGFLAAVGTFIANNWIAVTAIAGAAFSLAGILLRPDVPEGDNVTSPNNNLQARGNRARHNEPKPVLYGKTRLYPDLSAQPFSSFSGQNEQTLYMLYEITQGRCTVDIASMAFEDTPFSNFNTATYEIIEPGERSTLYPREVITSTEVDRQDIDQGQTIYYVANPPNTEITTVAVDIAFPRGIFYQKKSGSKRRTTVQFNVLIRPIDDDGVALGPPVAHPQTISGQSAEAISRSYYIQLDRGRYEVALDRVTPFDEDSREINLQQWMQLRGFIADLLPPTDSTRIAIRIRESDELGSRSFTQFNLVATRWLSAWSSAGGFAAEAETQSAAWAFVDACRNELYGGRRPDAFINLTDLEALAAEFEAEGLECNGVFDSRVTLWEALTRIGGTCFSSPIDEAGVYTLVRDRPRTVASQMFNMRNMVAGSFSIQHLTPLAETKDHVVVEFNDAAQDYRPTTLACVLPGRTSNNPEKVKLWGVTTESQASAIGMYLAAVNAYRREPVQFTAGLEGRVPRFNELVRASHYVLSQGGSPQIDGDVLAHSGSVLTLSESGLTTSTFSNPHVFLHNRRGEPVGPYPVSVVSGNQVSISVPFDASGLHVDRNRELPRFQMGEGTEFDELVRVVSLSPQDGESIRIEGFIDAPEVYNPGVPPEPARALERALTFEPRILNLTAQIAGAPETAGEAGGFEISLAWNGQNAERYDIEYSIDGGVTWVDMGEDLLQPRLTDVPVQQSGVIRYRVAGVNVLQGAWTEIAVDLDSGTVVGAKLPQAPNKLNLHVVGEGVEITVCAPAEEGIPTAFEIWRAQAPDNSIGTAQLIETVPAQFESTTGVYIAFKTDGDVIGGETYNYFVRARNEFGVTAAFPAGGGVPASPAVAGSGPQGPAGVSPVAWAQVGQWHWQRLADGTWKSPAGINQFTVDRVLRAFRGGVVTPISTHTIRATLDPATGFISVTDIGETGEDSNITSVQGAGSETVEVEITHVAEAQTVGAAFSSGADGLDGADGADAFPPGINTIGGRLTAEFIANSLDGNPNPGEVYVSVAGIFQPPGGNERQIAQQTIATPYEGGGNPPGGRAFVVSRPGGLVIAIHDDGWFTVDNSNVATPMSVTGDDWILATIFKSAPASQIERLTTHVPNVSNGQKGDKGDSGTLLFNPQSAQGDTFAQATHVGNGGPGQISYSANANGSSSSQPPATLAISLRVDNTAVFTHTIEVESFFDAESGGWIWGWDLPTRIELGGNGDAELPMDESAVYRLDGTALQGRNGGKFKFQIIQQGVV